MDDAGGRPLTICGIGGTGVHVVNRLQWFAERGHRVFLLTATPTAGGIPGVTEVVLRNPLSNPPRSQIRRFYSALPSPFRGAVAYAHLTAKILFTTLTFLRTVRAIRPDVVHAYSARQYYGWLTAVLGCKPLVVTVMGSDVAPFEERSEPATLREWLTVLLLRRADYITAPSGFLADVVNRLGEFREKSEYVLWGISLDRFRRCDASDLRRRLGFAPEARIILSPKILRPFYRIHLLVEAMPRIREVCPDAVLVMSEYVADAKYREKIARRIEELGLGDSAIFVGEIDHADMPAYYSMAEVSVAIPPRDAIPHALLESMACETPHILSRLPRYEEIVQHEESAYFVDPDPDSIAAGIIRLLEDEALRSRIAKQGGRIVEEQANLDELAARVERRFRKLVATKRARMFSLSALLSAVFAAAQAYPDVRRLRRASQGSQSEVARPQDR